MFNERRELGEVEGLANNSKGMYMDSFTERSTSSHRACGEDY